MFTRKKLLLLTFVILIISFLTYQGIKGNNESLNFTIYPLQYFQKGITAVHRAIKGFFSQYIIIVRRNEDPESLKKEIARYKELENEYLEAISENQRLRRILDIKRNRLDVVTVAEVYATSATNWYHTVTIDKGYDDGVLKDMIAITPLGLIGKVHRSMRNSADILLITDLNFGAAVQLQNSKISGILSGLGGSEFSVKQHKCNIKYISHDEKVHIGDRVITSGIDGLFPEGIYVGAVVDVRKERDSHFLYVEVSPMENLDGLEEVLILQR